MARMMGCEPADEGQIRAMCATAFHRRGFVAIQLDAVRNEFDRRHLERIAEGQYGKRNRETR